jgi:AcrR family transcriptional regulator
MGIKERRAREKQDLRQDILDAARDLFVSDGYQAVSMRKIAEKIEYSPATIYLHFQDKDELLDCLLEEAFAKLDAKLETRQQAEDHDPVSMLRQGLFAYVEFGLEHPAHYQITFMTPGVRYGEESERRSAVGCESFECLRKTVGACIEGGFLRVKDVDLASQVLWAGVHGITSLLIAKPSFPWVTQSELIEAMVDSLLGGMKQ